MNTSKYDPVDQEFPPAYDEPQASRSPGDNVPDDFKYSVAVASCELPVRQIFIRRVYSLLSLQIMGTVIVGMILHSNSSIRNWCLNNMWLLLVTGIASFGFLIATHFKARSYPTNLILLSAFTLCEAYAVGVVCSVVETDVLVQALLLTMVVFIGLTMFAFQTKYDFISWQGFASMALWFLIGWGILFMIFPGYSKSMDLVYSGVGALLFCLYILIDTQRIMKTAYLDDEIISTIALYLDILNLFLYILRIMQRRDS
ncbi:uncharacterized protein PRCAT00000190001 [Priceomyces carsonii]|uniref:uncharacterized protein n=1 Tax=Priceomyces carsonii TaxID=28549 RepID=UPI002ED90CAD|nr:unnamed protein product [Priceomyces carsonii]